MILLCPAVPVFVMVSLLWCSLFGISLILCQQKHAELCPTVSWKLGSCSAMSLVFNPRYVCFINRFMHMHHVFEVQEGIALHDPKLLLSGNSSPQKRKNYPEDIFIVTKKKTMVLEHWSCIFMMAFPVIPLMYLMQCESLLLLH